MGKFIVWSSPRVGGIPKKRGQRRSGSQLALHLPFILGMSPTMWTLPIVKHETNVIMNLNIGWGGFYTYSLGMGRILHLYVGIISLPPLRNR